MAHSSVIRRSFFWQRHWLPVLLALIVVVWLPTRGWSEEDCIVTATKPFNGQTKAVALAKGAVAASPFIFFIAKLRVNTDGAPISYSSVDLTGKDIAINNIANAVAVTNNETGQATKYGQTIKVFGQFRDANWTSPDGFSVHWQSVLAARKDGMRKVPCVFKSGSYAGYFGSLTTLQNGLGPEEAGECGVANQLDQREIPALVIPGGSSPLKAYGAKVGDLVFAFNPAEGVGQAAVIGDVGPSDNLGEGSVALNMALLKVTKQPSNYAEAKKLDTGKQGILLAVMPGTNLYERVRPYTRENISSRVDAWLTGSGYGTSADFAKMIRACASKLPSDQ